jgi:7-cyano-7-deazaguanine synthase
MTQVESAVVLLSGGVDSTTALAHTLATGCEVKAAVFVDYGQRHLREWKSAEDVTQLYKVPLLPLNLRAFGASVASVITLSDYEVPPGRYAEHAMGASVIPGRNAVMLSAAAGIAASQGAQALVIAVHAGDRTISTDCQPRFIKAMSSALGLGYGVGLSAPFVHSTKADIVRRGNELGAPLHLTWSCYESGAVHCGRCGTCVERQQAFHMAGVPDPTEYADRDYWWSVCEVTA